MSDPYFGVNAHPTCNSVRGHVCAQPSGRPCIEPGCTERAGTWWGPNWCPDHDAVRIDRISGQLHELTF